MYEQLLANLAILVLSGFVGFAVISKVPNTLHTPLMSGTNAIHGVVLVGALVVFGKVEHPSIAIQVILFVAVVFGTLNVVGGFVVTDRMLGMFKGKKPARVKVETNGQARLTTSSFCSTCASADPSRSFASTKGLSISSGWFLRLRSFR